MLGTSALPVKSVSIVGAFGLTIIVTCGLDSATDLSGWVAVAVYLKTPAVSWTTFGASPFHPHSTPTPRPFGASVYWLESTRPFHVFSESPTVTVSVLPSSGYFSACSCISKTKYPVVLLVPSVEIARAVYFPFLTSRPTFPVTFCPNGDSSVAVPLTGVKLKPLWRFSNLKSVTLPLSSIVMRRVFTASPR